MNDKADSESRGKGILESAGGAAFRNYLCSARLRESRNTVRLSLALFLCALALLPFLPLASAILLVQFIFSSPFRGVLNALMLSALAGYSFLVYLSFADRWTSPPLEAAALTLALALGFLGRLRHDRVARTLVRRNAVLERMVTIDELTDLYSRRHVLDLAKKEFQRSVRSGTPLSVLLVDVDNLGEINDRFGRMAGDATLLVVAQAFRKILRSQDVAGRIGSDAFVVLLVDTGEDGARETALRLQQGIAVADLNRHPVNPRVSIGFAQRSDRTPDLPALIADADRALHDAKSGTDRSGYCPREKPLHAERV